MSEIYNKEVIKKFDLEKHLNYLATKFSKADIVCIKTIFNSVQTNTQIPMEAILFCYKGSGVKGNYQEVNDARAILAQSIADQFSGISSVQTGIIINRDHASVLSIWNTHNDHVGSKSNSDKVYCEMYKNISTHISSLVEKRVIKFPETYSYEQLIEILLFNGISNPVFPERYILS